MRAWFCSGSGLPLGPAASQAATLRPAAAAGGSLQGEVAAPAPVPPHSCWLCSSLLGIRLHRALYLADLSMHGLPPLPLCRTSSRSSSTRAAAQNEATTTAMARLQEVGATKLAAGPQAARGAAFQPNLASDWHLDAPAAVERRSAFSKDMLVKA